MLSLLRKIIPEDSLVRVLYSWTKAITAKLIYGNPSKNLIIIGVTGTDGKTTTSHFTAQLLKLLGMKIALISTEQIWIGDKIMENESKRTSLNPFYTQKLLKQACEENCKAVILEVSSHAITQGRMFGIDFNGAIMTNICKEHGNYHKSMLDYVQTKARLFKYVKKSKKKNTFLILNKKTEYFNNFAEIQKKITTTYSLEENFVYSNKNLKNQYDELIASNIRKEGDSLKFVIHELKTKNKKISHYNKHVSKLNMLGSYNVENALAAILVAQKLKINLKDIIIQIPKLAKIPGRLEEVITPKDYKVFIDFALTAGAFSKVLLSLKNICKGKVIHVFGATGGNHDHSKRPDMGEISSKLSDFVILTEDETYGEDNSIIINDIKKGFKKGFKNYKVIEDRKEAIHHALKIAKKDDYILITGMGNFRSRFNGKEEIPWSDRDCVTGYYS